MRYLAIDSLLSLDVGSMLRVDGNVDLAVESDRYVEGHVGVSLEGFEFLQLVSSFGGGKTFAARRVATSKAGSGRG